ncbi:unnamed protein product [Haemonchus placei]|uniref:DUF5375 family protein n=1 Tax=Haemonchus placei TaxID=6290 RepID=A0A0N4WG85_HAEPC|nr:unnamed protein product [Haemonchus placei]
MLLALAGYIDVIPARRILGSLSKLRIREYVCHEHVVQAAQYLLAEMAMLGITLRFSEDPSSPVLHAYASFADIPRGIVEELNRLAEGAITVGIRDVCNFLNDALKRYYGSNIWPVTDEVLNL